MWIGKTAGQKGGCPICPKCDCDIVLGVFCSPAEGLASRRAFQHFSHKSCDRRALASGQGDMGEERVALQSFDHGDNSIMATDPEVVSLGNIVGQDNSRGGSNSGEHRQQDATF